MTYVTSRRQRPTKSYDVLCSKRVKKHCTYALINEPTTTKEMKTFYTLPSALP